MPSDREPELAAVLRGIERRLAPYGTKRGPGADAYLERIESYAGPWALALYGEVRRLESLIAELRPSRRRCRTERT